jgi:hypothetical protein
MTSSANRADAGNGGDAFAVSARQIGMMSRRSFTLLVGALVLAGQQSSDRYGPLIRALALTDAQVAQFHDNLGPSMLDGTQRVRLAEIARVLQRYDTSASAIVLGLMDDKEWPSGWPCFVPNARADVYSKEFDLTAEQVRQFQQLQHDVRLRAVDQITEAGKRLGKLLPGQRLPPSEWVTLQEETAKCVKQRDEARPPRDLAMAVLDEAQKAKLAAFRADLELAREALELHLIRVPPLPDPFCR